jgi:hypothetical protein
MSEIINAEELELKQNPPDKEMELIRKQAPKHDDLTKLTPYVDTKPPPDYMSDPTCYYCWCGGGCCSRYSDDSDDDSDWD